MNIIFQEVVGYSAGALVLISIIPQIIKSWKTKSTKDLSLSRYLLYEGGVLLWLTYGLMLNNGPIILVNSLNLTLTSSILFLKIYYG